MEKIMEGLYRIEVPLPNNPLKSLNSYVITGKRPLIIDTGFNMEQCYAAMLGGLRKLGIEPKKVDVLATHLHADHLGLAGKIAKNLLISRIDAEVAVKGILNPDYWKDLTDFYARNGFPEDETKKVVKIHPGVKYISELTCEITFLEDGEKIEYGDFLLEVVSTPGHTPGHVCLYDKEKKVLFSGDHILFDITPNITFWEFMEDSLGSYLKSLEKVYRLDVDLTLPGHRNFRGSHRKRIEEIIFHHKKRLEEAFNAVQKGSSLAWEIAQKITWDLVYEKWEELPTMQKWFAVGETIAHLEHLTLQGKIRKEENDFIRYLP
ncbi:MAG: MBL fold metallo-hydrolase [Archaeoglobus sp.]|nr:MBL fold metallo-hydrolase [Archaeoglobus sp.]